jgi:hypothetical protein
MPTPVPTPTAAEIVTVSEIVMLSTDEVAEMIAADSDQDISNAKWAATLIDIDNWPGIRDETGDLKKIGDIEFFEGTAPKIRLDFRNIIRVRYGKLYLFYEGRIRSDRFYQL